MDNFMLISFAPLDLRYALLAKLKKRKQGHLKHLHACLFV